MDRSTRLHIVGKITYYVGWIALLLGGLMQMNIAKAFFMSMGVSKRNLFEVSVMCFIICVASEVRAFTTVEEKELAPVVRRQAAA